MKFLFILLIIISLKCTASGFQAENQDSISVDSLQNLKTKLTLKSQILPISLITVGSLLNIGEIKNHIQDKLPNTNTNVEDYLQYAPIAEMYLSDALGFKHQNSIFDQTKYLAISQLTTSLLVHLLKSTTKVKRPNGEDQSFPSGHTSAAFVGATVLFQEFKNTEPILAYSGYLFATTTGVLRMTNDAHWLPDVLVGAGIGILTTNLVYYFKPLQGFQPFHKKKDIVVIPMINSNSLGFQCRF
jgi:membrane-associated phospholipid phosphatase